MAEVVKAGLRKLVFHRLSNKHPLASETAPTVWAKDAKFEPRKIGAANILQGQKDQQPPASSGVQPATLEENTFSTQLSLGDISKTHSTVYREERSSSADNLDRKSGEPRRSHEKLPQNGVEEKDLPAERTSEAQPISMPARKIWVKRQGASATLIKVNDDDLVDDVRDMILRKYSNSLGRTFDAPDVELRILPRAHAQPHLHEGERRLAPDEVIGSTLDSYFPNGQSVEEALLIEVPQRRTPKASPRVVNHLASLHNPEAEHGEAPSYFPPMAVMSPHQHPGQHRSQTMAASLSQPHTISVLTTGHVPDIPSPGGRSFRNHRPKPGRTNTVSPTMVTSSVPKGGNKLAQLNANTLNLRPRPHRSRASSESSDLANGRGSGGPIPTAPALPASHSADNAPLPAPTKVSTPPGSGVMSPMRQPGGTKGRKHKRGLAGGANNGDSGSAAGGPQPPLSSEKTDLIPPINCLIVEDNIINLRLLEAFMRRLKVRWASAMNGKEALTKWRTGGFHLVLMDIQLPVMNGLDATKEIRRVERLNGIGVFASSVGSGMETPQCSNKDADGQIDSTVAQADGQKDGNSNGEPPAASDNPAGQGAKASNGSLALFKSPVIIVALTASSLQSDRNEALAAGCNDFLTKPVSYPWLERKVMEWGCMQALIDFDGWRKWKDFASVDAGNKKNGEKSKAGAGGKHRKRHSSTATALTGSLVSAGENQS